VAGHRRGGGWRLMARGGAALGQGARRCGALLGGGPEQLIAGDGRSTWRCSQRLNAGALQVLALAWHSLR
jgi:hypothetical protein